MNNLSEEEKKAIESLRKNRGVSFAQADIISNLIEKQQKEIEELKKYEEGYKLLNYGLDNYISKDKIKVKIAEYDKKKKDIPHEIDLKAFYTITDIRNIQIDVLQSLLEED